MIGGYMTAFVFKIIAMISMTVDHCTAMFSLPAAGALIGRLALPLYAFMIVDSYNHLRTDRGRLKKYIISVAVLAVISEFAFDFAYVGHLFFWSYQNQLLQFLLVLLVFVATEKLGNVYINALLWIMAVSATFFLRLGYLGADTVIMIIMKRYLDRRNELTMKGRFLYTFFISLVFIVSSVIVNALLSSGGFTESITNAAWLSPIVVEYGIPSVVLVFLFALYNGKYGNPPRWFRVVYRYFYPAHLAVLGLIQYFFI